MCARRPASTPPGAYLSPRTPGRHYDGPGWSDYDGIGGLQGLLAAVSPWRDWTLHVGLYRSLYDDRSTSAHLPTDLTADGLANRLIIVDPRSRASPVRWLRDRGYTPFACPPRTRSVAALRRLRFKRIAPYNPVNDNYPLPAILASVWERQPANGGAARTMVFNSYGVDIVLIRKWRDPSNSIVDARRNAELPSQCNP